MGFARNGTLCVSRGTQSNGIIGSTVNIVVCDIQINTVMWYLKIEKRHTHPVRTLATKNYACGNVKQFNLSEISCIAGSPIKENDRHWCAPWELSLSQIEEQCWIHMLASC
jgi:hypothetical protein